MSFRPTIADVAREAGVSRQTVLRVLNNKGEISSNTLSRVREVIEWLDCRISSMGLVIRSLPGCSMVCVDDTLGAGVLVRHLLRGGRCPIGFLAVAPTSYSSREWARGYAQAMATAGGVPAPEFTVRCPHLDLESGCGAALTPLTAQPEVDAIMCHNGLVAIGMLHGLR